MVIAFLRGTLRFREITGSPCEKVVVDVGGVGFELLASRSTASELGSPGADVTIFTSLSVRENEWTLFGFASQEEKEMFGLLQTVTGVGPKMALSLVGTLGPSRIAESVAADDFKMLSQAPGVGPKLAQRIVLELKSKCQDWQARLGTPKTAAGSSAVKEEARAILEELGYTRTEIARAFEHVDGQDDVEEVVRRSLKVLGSVER